jgi:carbamoyl-phosphate synthase large subunit
VTDTIWTMVTGVGCPLGQSIVKALRGASLRLKIVAADADPFSAGLSWGDARCVLPRVGEPRYLSDLIESLRRYHVRALFVGTDAEQQPIAQWAPVIERETSAKVMSLSEHVLSVANDKFATAEFLRTEGFLYPQTWLASSPAIQSEIAASVGFPVIVKPRRGRSGDQVLLVRSTEALSQHVASLADPSASVVQEYVGTPDEEYTTGVYCDRAGSAIAALTMRRVLEFGLTYKAHALPGCPAASDAMRIAERLGVTGSCNVQSRKTSRGFITFEINPRFSSTTSIRAHFGLNEPELAVREHVLGEQPRPAPLRGGYALRYWEEAYYSEEHQFHNLM